MLKCLSRILQMRGSAVLYVKTNGTTSLESLGLVCNPLVREILTERRNCLRTDLTNTGVQSTKLTLTTIKSKPTTVSEHFLSHSNHSRTDMQLIPLEKIHSSRDP